MAYPIERFDDFVPADDMAMPEPTVESAALLEAEPGLVEPLWDADAAKVDGLLAQYADVVSDVTMNAMFAPPKEPQGSMSQAEMWDKIFIELNWKWFNDFFGGALVIPPRPADI